MDDKDSFEDAGAPTDNPPTEGSSVRKIVLTAVSMALLTAPAALAHRGGDRNNTTTDPVATTPQTPAVTLAPCVKAPGGRRAEFILRGVVASVSGSTISVQATSVNSKMRKALQGPTAQGGGSYNALIPVTVADCTRVDGRGRSEKSRGGRKNQGLQAFVAGARIKVEWRAPRGTAFADLGSPKRIRVR